MFDYANMQLFIQSKGSFWSNWSTSSDEMNLAAASVSSEEEEEDPEKADRLMAYCEALRRRDDWYQNACLIILSKRLHKDVVKHILLPFL